MDKKFLVEDLKSRLDKYLAERVKDISRSQIQRDIEAGLVLVNEKKVLQGKFVVRKGDKIKYEALDKRDKEKELEPVNISLNILYDNHGLLVINKPPGLAVHPGAGLKSNSLASALLYHFSPHKGSPVGGKEDISLVGEKHRPGIVHRLDKDTSGVMLIAKTPAMYEYLRDAFSTRKVKKEYVALVCGEVAKNHEVINTPIGKSKRDFRKQDVKDITDPKEAVTEYWVLERLDQYTLVRVNLHTGRTHQIRVHFNSIGHPLAGDILYGGKKSFLAGLNRQFLHAKKIEVCLPDKTWIEAESELADDLKEVLKNLNSKKVNQL